MKAKLLKKVRKRFEIFHLPKGYSAFGGRYEFNLFKLVDLNNSYVGFYVQCGIDPTKEIQYSPKEKIFSTEKECVDFLKSQIIHILRREGYTGKKDKDMFDCKNKIWYK
jgi:hypothetical protein